MKIAHLCSPFNMCFRYLYLLLPFVVLPLRGEEQVSDASLLSGAMRTSGLPKEKESVVIPLTPTFVGLTIQANIDGKVVNLILDTGAAATHLSPKTAARVGLKGRDFGGSTIGISGGRKKSQIALTGHIKLGEAWTRNEPVFITELPDGAGDGVLGLGTLADWDVRIDPASNTLTLFPAGKALALEGETVLPLTCEVENPIASANNPQGLRRLNLSVPVRIGSHDLLAIPDTGKGGALQMSGVIMNRFAPAAMKEALPGLVSGIDLTGHISTKSAKLPEFTFGPDSLRNLPIDVLDAPPGSDSERMGYIGLPLLRHYVMTFRFSERELRLKPLGTVQQLTRTSTAGINLDPNNVILSVVPAGPADKAGLRSGDQLLEIQGRSLKTMTPTEFAAFKQLAPGTTVKILYRRGAAEPEEINLELVKQ